MTNKHIELPALLDKVGQHIEAALCIDDGWADRIMHMDKARKHLAAYRAAIADHEQARVVGEPVSDVTSIGAMCLILEANLIKADEYTDCAIVYKVTFDQLRNLYDQGRATNKHAVHDSDCSTNNRGCPELLGPCDCSASPPAPQEEQADWREHVEQRIRTWRQSTMNRSGDRLAIDDFMGASEVDDLVDFVCDEYAAPVAQPATEQAEAREEQWRVVTWSSKTDRTFTKRDEALEYLRANDTDGDWHIKHVPGKKTTIYDGWFGEQAEAPSDKMSYAMLEEQNEQIRELNTSLDVECARLEKEVSVLTEMLHREVCATQPTASNAGERWPQPEFRKCEHCGCETNAKMRACCRAGWVDDKVASESRAALSSKPVAPPEREARHGQWVDTISHWVRPFGGRRIDTPEEAKELASKGFAVDPVYVKTWSESATPPAQAVQDSATDLVAWLLKTHPHSFINPENMEKFMREFAARTRGNGVEPS